MSSESEAELHPDHAINRGSWDALASVHGQDAYYDTEALVAGASSLIEEEEAALRGVMGPELAGRRVLHLQCHLGFDAITFARRGATVTGVDFSPVALARAAHLARACGVDVEWVRADAIALPDVLTGRFDLVWATFGILCWIADLHAWMRSVRRALAPGGALVLIDGYPLQPAGAPPPRRRLVQRGCDYATDTHTGPQVQFVWSLEEIRTAAVDAGFARVDVRAHADVSADLCVDDWRRETDGRYRRRVDGVPRPVLFSLVGSAPP